MMLLFIGTSLIYVFLLTNRLKFVDSVKTSPVHVRLAATSFDFIDVNVHKHQALLSAYSSVPDYYRRNIERMMSDPELKTFMAYKGDVLVGCADLISIDVGNHYHIQNVIVASDHRRCGVASSILREVVNHVTLEKISLLKQNKCSQSDPILELDVDRSNFRAKALYIKDNYCPKFTWCNLLNHRQRMFKVIKIQPSIPNICNSGYSSISQETWTYVPGSALGSAGC